MNLEQIEAEILSEESIPVDPPKKIAKVGAITDAIKEEELLIGKKEESIASYNSRIRKLRKDIAQSKRVIAQLEKANQLKQS